MDMSHKISLAQYKNTRSPHYYRKPNIFVFKFLNFHQARTSIFPTPSKVTHPQTRNISEKNLFVIVVSQVCAHSFSGVGCRG